MWLGPLPSVHFLELPISIGLTVLFKVMHNKEVQCWWKVSSFTTFKLFYFSDHGTYMIHIKLLGILSWLCSFALFNDNLFNKLSVSGPLKYKLTTNKQLLWWMNVQQLVTLTVDLLSGKIAAMITVSVFNKTSLNPHNKGWQYKIGELYSQNVVYITWIKFFAYFLSQSSPIFQSGMTKCPSCYRAK